MSTIRAVHDTCGTRGGGASESSIGAASSRTGVGAGAGAEASAPSIFAARGS